jgi:hypothetical protein
LNLEDPSQFLWWLANVLLAVLTVAMAYYGNVILAIVLWVISFLLLMVFRPQ